MPPKHDDADVPDANGALWTRLEVLEDKMNDLGNKLDGITDMIHGDSRGELGFSQKLAVLWRVMFIWPIATGSALAGALVTLLVQWISKHI